MTTDETKTTWTDEILKSFNPCADGYAWYVENCREENITDTTEIIKLLMADKKQYWANWTLGRAFSRKDRIRYAIFSAEQVIDFYEKKYPKNKTPRKAIEAARAVLEGDTEDNAISAAVAVAFSAYYAAPAFSVDYAAAAVAFSAYYAARAAYNSIQTKILNYGITLLEANK